MRKFHSRAVLGGMSKHYTVQESVVRSRLVMGWRAKTWILDDTPCDILL